MNYFAPITAIISPLGSLSDSEELLGVSSATLENLKYSNKKYKTPREILLEFELNGASYGSASAREYSYIYIRTPQVSLPSSQKLLASLLSESYVTKESANKVIENAKNSIEEIRAEAYSYAESKFIKNLADLELPDGTAKTLNNIKQIDIQSKLAEIQKNMVELTLESSNGFEHKDLRNLSNLKNLNNSIRIPKRTKKNIVFDNKEIPQVHMFLGYLTEGTLSDAPINYATLTVANALLGSNECGLAFKRVREEKSLAYQVYQTHSLGRNYGINYFYAGVASENVLLATRTLMGIINEVSVGKIPDSLLETSKNVAIGKIKKAMDEPEYAFRYYLRQFTKNFDLENVITLTDFIEQLKKVTVIELQNYFQKVYVGTKPLLYVYGATSKLEKDKFNELLLND